jgi:pyruvate-ferredoxin/flavodoxin oxidoreductase
VKGDEAPAGPRVHGAGRARGLHRLRLCVEVCPAKDKPATRSARRLDMSRWRPHRDASARRFAFFESCPRRRSSALKLDKRSAQLLRAAVRVLGRLRRLRRDAVHPAAHPALRRPPADRQRHRLLVDLRRQPADHAVHHRTPTAAARRGPTRCSRTTPSSASGMRLGIDAPARWTGQGAARGGGAAAAGGAGRRAGRADRARRGVVRGAARARRAAAETALASDPAPRRAALRGWPTAGAARACGSSAATAGPTTSATAASTTCWRRTDVNVLVLDTEVYSNTGGQQSKATPLGAAAKFAAAGKAVAQEGPRPPRDELRPRLRRAIAPAGEERADREALLEAERHPGPSLVIAHSPCIAHGYDLVNGADAAEARGRQRRVAALPLRSGAGRPRRGAAATPSCSTRRAPA